MPEQNWELIGGLPEGSRLAVLGVNAAGHGLAGVSFEADEGSLEERMRTRRAQLLRVTSKGLLQVKELGGWIQCLNGQGQNWCAVNATLSPEGVGSRYRLLLSRDDGKTWEDRGAIPASSVAQIVAVSEQELWVLGANYLGLTRDGGTTWMAAQASGERNPFVERLRRIEGGVALLGNGIAQSTDGGQSFVHEAAGGAQVIDGDGHVFVGRQGGTLQLGTRSSGSISWRPCLLADREPLRLVASGSIVRLASRAADPSRGIDLKIHRSEDGGRSWSDIRTDSTAQVDLAGDWAGLTASLGGDLLGVLSP